jgi:hypothetical protein
MAGAMSGANMMGLSMKRAGKTWVEATGEPGKMGGKAGFDSPGTKRAGDPEVQATGRMAVSAPVAQPSAKSCTMGKNS